MMIRGGGHRRKRAAVAVCAVLAGFATTGQSSHAAVEYVQVCSAAGAPGYFKIPGTDLCQNANQIADNQYNVNRDFSRAMLGIAMTSAIVTPFVPDGANYAISVHWANYDAKNAIGLAGALRLPGNWVLTAGAAFGVDSGSVTISTVQATDSGFYSPVRSWNSFEAMGKLGLEYSW